MLVAQSCFQICRLQTTSPWRAASLRDKLFVFALLQLTIRGSNEFRQRLEEEEQMSKQEELKCKDEESQIEDLPATETETDEVKAGGIVHAKPVLAWARVDGTSS